MPSAERSAPREAPPREAPPREAWAVASPTAAAGALRGLPARLNELRRPRSVVLLFRSAMLLLAAAVALGKGELGDSLAWIVALAALIALGHRADSHRHALVMPALEAAVCCAGVLLAGGASSALLVYLPAPSLAAGVSGGVRGVVLATGLQSALLFGGRPYLGDQLGSWSAFSASAGQWVGLALAVGLLAVWAGGQQRDSPAGDAGRYAEAHRLLDRLRTVTRRLPGSLDPDSSAQALLLRCIALAPATTRGAVLLVDEPAQLVPLAVVGARRVPWRSPLTEPGPLRDAYTRRTVALDVRPPDSRGGKRSGSALLVLPIHLGDHAVGLVVLESPQQDAFSGGRIALLEGVVAEDAIQLDTALLFDEVRTWASLQERERLAQDMHDGVAQDLAYVGFELDALRHQLLSAAPGLADDVARLRKQLTAMVSDLRLSITDLRSGIGQERGLGSALTSYARGVATARGLAVHLSLDESSFRLPGETEVQLFRAAQELIAVVRHDPSVTTLWVALTVDPPSASLRVQHDGNVVLRGGLGEIGLTNVCEHVERLGGRLTLSPAGAECAWVLVELGEDEA